MNVECGRHFIGTFCVTEFGSWHFVWVIQLCVCCLFVIVSCADVILCLRLFTVYKDKQQRKTIKGLRKGRKGVKNEDMMDMIHHQNFSGFDI